MKKLFILLMLFVASTQLVSAQQACDCNPNGFNPFQYAYLGANQTISTGHQLSVKCKSPIKINGGYKCTYTNKPCDVKFVAVVNNSAGVAIKTIENFSFPFEYEFENGGNYTVFITPFCGGKKCASAKFYFNVACNEVADCNCNKAGWDNIYASIDNISKQIKCGETIDLKVGKPFALKGGYKCEGNCDAVLNAKLTNLSTGTVQNFPNFKMDGVNYPFPVAGKYKLVINPLCKNKKCPPCTIFINVQ